MSPAVAQELRLLSAASLIEGASSRRGEPAPNAEAFHMGLWRHRSDIIDMIRLVEAIQDLRPEILTALQPFARAAHLFADSNPVLVSIPAGGRSDYVQLRPADFRQARKVWEALTT